MDPITHCLVGGLTAKTIGTSKRRFWIMMFLGIAPDLDVLFNPLGGWAFWLQHRGFSHSILGLVFQSFFFAWFLKRWDSGPFKERALHYSLPLTFHVLCDYLTHYGVPLFSPFSFQDFSADLVVSLTLIPALFMAAGLVWMHYRGKDGWSAARPLWMGWVVYLFVAASGKAYAIKLVNASPGSVTAIPSMINPFSWAAIRQDEATRIYHTYSIDLLKGEQKTVYGVSGPTDEFPIQASLKSSEVQHFLKNSRWPVVRYSALPDGWQVEWGNLLFSSRGMVRGKWLVRLSSQGEIKETRRIFSFWDPKQHPNDQP